MSSLARAKAPEPAAPDPVSVSRTGAATLPTRSPGRRGLLLLPAGLALLAGLDAALLLLGVPAPVTATRLPDVHGMLMVFGFVGTLIALERAVALGRRPGYCAPALLGLGGLALLSPAPLAVGRTMLLLGAAALVGVYVPLWRRQRDDAVLTQALGAVLATGALALWLGGVPVATTLPWLTGFVVLTIGGERLELARLAMGPRAGTVLVLLASVLTGAVVPALLWPDVGGPLMGLSLLVLTLWLAAHDVARRTARTSGLPRFIAANLLAGYAWLVVAGGVWLLAAAPTSGGAYDALIHAVFLGFTISMVMAHAPVILPAVMRRPLPYRPILYAPVVLLHAGLVVRLWLGDGRGLRTAWQVGGVVNVAALLLFVVLAGYGAVRGRRG